MQRDYRERFRTARRSALMLRIVDLAFERPVRSTGEVAEALGVTYAGSAKNLREPIAHGVAEEVEGIYPKLIRFRGWWRRCGWGIEYSVPGLLASARAGTCRRRG